VPIDHAGPADAPDTPHPPDDSRPPDSSRPPGAIPASPPAADRIAAHRAYRVQVEQVYRDSTRDGMPADARKSAWAEALTSLRATWAEHQERYPERVRAAPETHPDNSWSSGKARRLTPDQNNEASEACAGIHEEGERLIFPAMRRIESADPDRQLAGLEHMLKGADRLKEKVAERLRYHPDLAPRQAAADVPDAVRFTLEYSESHYTEGVLADVERLKGAGYELLKLKNLWAKDQYKGINSQWRRPETGLRFEVQFHTPESLEAKELTHKAYERLRDPLTSKAEESTLEDYQRRVNALVGRPPDVFNIEDYPPEKRDG
jgi:hypothetical protein